VSTTAFSSTSRASPRRRSASSLLLLAVAAARRREAVEPEPDAVERERAAVERLAGARFAVVFFAGVFLTVARLAPVGFLAVERLAPVVFRALVDRDDELRDDVDLPEDDDRREDELLLDFGCGISRFPPCGGGPRGRYRSVATLVAVLALALAVAAPASAADNPWLKLRVLNIAHQGGEDEFPSNTLYAFHKAMDAGADMLELDVGVTKDNHVVFMHDTSVDRTTNGKGLIKDYTLKQIEKLDNAYWFSGGTDAYAHDKAKRAYRFRGIATGNRKPPKGFTADDFRVATLDQVLKAFPRVPINVEIKGRTKKEDISEYRVNARVLARDLKGSKHPDLIVVSFKQQAVDLFHSLDPGIDTAPGVDGAAAYLLGNVPLPPGSVAMQMPITYKLGDQTLEITSPANVQKAHQDGYAWQTWMSGNAEDTPTTWETLIGDCVDGIMTARPVALERMLQVQHIPGPGRSATDPCPAT
jgi:glycerophosphoryl diester phosphodiesterase